MKYFLKLNVVSMLYAMMMLVPIELVVNVYRISRWTTWDIDFVMNLSYVIIIVEVIAGTMLIIFLTKKWLDGRMASFWNLVLWLPYLILFAYIIAKLFPMTYRGDTPNPAMGLLIMGGLLVYPFYILVINSVNITIENRVNKTS
ncbi:hypothetical protein [Bacillus solimangrovi]|uniref:Uncharacterized protein n=1 Tax=Bacillus solimangrovi TaxID=1305675 RepID=A0A1E5LAS2_9BACI|nr:hypothetical protein [Bacillus solimangrovi]OEH91163.1 hypothetical protein BFG57_07235 [Bacillus solimangrovi]